MSPMEGVFIDADFKSITPWRYAYGDLGPKLGGSICIGHVFASGDVLYVDDAGLLKPARRAFRIRSRKDGQPMLSHGIVTGRDSNTEDGLGTLPPRLSIPEVEREIQFLTVAEAMNWFYARAAEPAVTRQVPGKPLEVLARWSDIIKNLEGQPGGYNPAEVFR